VHVVLWRFCTVLGVVVWLSSAHERWWINYWDQDGTWIHHISNANCKTENIIYLLECAIYGLQYVGETKQQLSKRLNGHRSDANCKPDLPLSRYLYRRPRKIGV
jgi:hypothetical protein